MATENKSASLWMGDLEPYMDETFIKGAFAAVGYAVCGVKEMKLKSSGERANYCFVDLGGVDIAAEALLKLQGRVIPGTENKKHFKLNVAGHGKSTIGSTEYSLFVGDLSNDVTDNHLLKFFRDRYPSVRAAKIVTDDKGESKGYGFVRFFNEGEINDAYTTMQGATGLGQKPIRVNPAMKGKDKRATAASTEGSPASLVAAPASSADMSANMMAWMQAMSIMAPQMQAYMVQMSQWMQQLQHCVMGQQASQSPESWGAAALQWQHQMRQQQEESELASSPHVAPLKSSNMPVEATAGSQLHSPKPVVSQLSASRSGKEILIEDGHLMVEHAYSVDVDSLNKTLVETEECMFFEMDSSRYFDDFYSSVL